MTDHSQPTILHFDSIDSTNLEALRQARAGAAEGLCIVARAQTQGRGRLDRSWQSPKDAGLYCSLVLRPKLEMNAWPLITLMTALAVCDALQRACRLSADIKWPNDLCVNDRKLCGILAETIETETGTAAIVGIGINLKADSLPATVSDLATSVEAATGMRPDSVRLLDELLKAIGERYELLQSPLGGEHTIREWCAQSSYAFGRQVRVGLEDDTFEGTTRGLESDGALRVETAGGKIRIVRAGDVTALRPTGNL
ncbi:MAG: BirA family transcriptional regulator [Blastocatellia bacterium]|jgi:BirA family biotin operon repressor/biotin-[acetyl-CoA-carboxylase] ligase|nr:BirA family transcriptional regulator [Blastocatellia bacterium]